ncbi:MAG: AraC family ligand binding domain-containing protein [Elainellaceae cyanobacterium]
MSNAPRPKPAPNIVKAWTLDETLLEFYRYAPQQPEKLPPHCHDHYQICFSVNYPSEYYYRKAVHHVPVRSLSSIHPGEMHGGTGRDVGDRHTPATFRMMYLPSAVIRHALGDALKGDLPFFADLIILDSDLARLFSGAHRASEAGAPRLEQDERLQAFLTALIQRYGDRPSNLCPLSTFVNPLQPLQNLRQVGLSVNYLVYARLAIDLAGLGPRPEWRTAAGRS